MRLMSHDQASSSSACRSHPPARAKAWIMLVRSPAAPKITLVAGAGLRPGKLFSIVAAASAAMVAAGVLASPRDAALLRRDDGALPSRSMSALLTIVPTNALGRGFAEPLMQNPKQLCGLGRYVTALDELGVSLDDFKCRGVAFGPEADVELVLADAEVAHRQIGQPVRKRRIDVQLIAWRIRLKPQ